MRWTDRKLVAHSEPFEADLTLRRPLLSYAKTATKHPVPHRVKPSFVIFDIRALTISPERQSAQMSKITNDGLTRSGTGSFTVVPI